MAVVAGGNRGDFEGKPVTAEQTCSTALTDFGTPHTTAVVTCGDALRGLESAWIPNEVS